MTQTPWASPATFASFSATDLQLCDTTEAPTYCPHRRTGRFIIFLIWHQLNKRTEEIQPLPNWHHYSIHLFLRRWNCSEMTRRGWCKPSAGEQVPPATSLQHTGASKVVHRGLHSSPQVLKSFWAGVSAGKGCPSLPPQSSFPFLLLWTTRKLGNPHKCALIQIQAHHFIGILLLCHCTNWNP